MIDGSALEGVDAGGIHRTYDRWPELASEFYGREAEPVDDAGIDHVVFAGMGGSGTVGDVFSSILSRENMHVSVVKGYRLPRTADAGTLVVATSVSGDTDETMAVLAEAAGAGIRTVSFASGGRMEGFCRGRGLRFHRIPRHHSPRASLVPFLYGILRVLAPLLPVRESEVAESISVMRRTRDLIHSGNLGGGNPALSLGSWIGGIAAIYYPFGLQSAAMRFKNSLQENAKMHAFAEDVMEASHNGIVSYERDSEVRPILVQGTDDHVRTRQRWGVIKGFFEESGIEYREVRSVRGGILSKLVNLIYLLDYASIYLAVSRGVDPTPVGPIDYVKRRTG